MPGETQLGARASVAAGYYATSAEVKVWIDILGTDRPLPVPYPRRPRLRKPILRRPPALGRDFPGFPFACLSALVLTSCEVAPPRPPDAQLISAIRILADQDDLRDPDEVGRVLKSHLIRHKRTESYHPRCLGTQTPLVTDQEAITYSPSAGFWFRRKPEGQDVTVYSLLSGTSSQTGEPRFHYNVSNERLCYPGWTRLSQETDATISFENVPGFACITEKQLKALLPKAKRLLATDGAIPYGYVAGGEEARLGEAALLQARRCTASSAGGR